MDQVECVGSDRVRAEFYGPCPECHFERGRACDVCGGVGQVNRLDHDEPPALPDDLIDVELVLVAWASIERHGIEAWRREEGFAAHEEPAGEFMDAVELFGNELARLDHARDVRRAKAAAAERERQAPPPSARRRARG